MTLLTLRLTRRVIGAAAIRDGAMALLDGRFLNSRTERTVPSAMRYIGKLLEQTKPDMVVLDAPGSDSSHVSGQIRRELMQVLASRNTPLYVLARGDLLTAFGVSRVEDRREIRELLSILWPEVDRFSGKTQPFIADAAAAALYAETLVALGIRSP